MGKYIKLPVTAYESTEYNKYLKSKDIDQTDEDEDEIDAIVRRSSRKVQEVDSPTGVVTYSRYPIKRFKNCTFEASCSIETSDLNWGVERFTHTMLYFEDGEMAQISMSVDSFEDLMIEHGIVDISIKEQFPKSKL